MSQVRGFAKFERRGEHTFRTETYLQFGNSSKSIGSCLLLNPGAAELISLNMNSGEVKLDTTMKQLVIVINKIYNDIQIDGRFHIYNVFPLQNPKSRQAIMKVEELVGKGELSYKDCMPPLENLKKHPWIIIGWGVKTKRSWLHFEELKKQWMNLIQDAGILYFGKQHSLGKYYHLCPQLQSKRSEMVEELHRIYVEMI